MILSVLFSLLLNRYHRSISVLLSLFSISFHHPTHYSTPPQKDSTLILCLSLSPSPTLCRHSAQTKMELSPQPSAPASPFVSVNVNIPGSANAQSAGTL